MSTVTIRLPEKLSKELDQAAKQEKLNRSELLRAALEDYLTRRLREQELEKYKAAARAIDKDEARAMAEEDLIPGNEVWFAAESAPKTWPKKKRGRR